MFKYRSLVSKYLLSLYVFFLSSIVFSYNPLDPLLWPDPDYKPKLTPVKFIHFQKPQGAIAYEGVFSGYLETQKIPLQSNYKVVFDELEINKKFKSLSKLPSLSLEFSIKNSKFIPISGALRTTQNLFWDMHFGVGEVWYDETGNIRTSFPFSFIQKNQNCVHNGIVLFDMTTGGEISNLVYQVASETCAYFKFDLISSHEAVFIENSDLKKDLKKHDEWLESKIPVKSISQFKEFSKLFGSTKEVSSVNMTVYGFYDGKSHYRGGCLTRKGRYPYCDEMLLPSFSLSKSIFAANAMSLLGDQFSKIENLLISDYVTQCDQKKWRGVTFGNTLDMATGQYKYKKYYSEDWYLRKNGFSNNYKHKDRITFSCDIFKKNALPGTKLSYHSSDTYILGTALNNFYKQKVNKNGDLYYDLMLPLWKSLKLSDATSEVRRSLDKVAQPYAEMGMFLLSDDVVKLGKYFLHRKETDTQGILFNALQSNSNQRGLVAIDPLYYNKGFWTKRFEGTKFGCSGDLWVPFMSGFGGITVVLLPNNTMYYYFSDGNEFQWDLAVEASNKLKPFCP